MNTARSQRHTARRWLDHIRREGERLRLTLQLRVTMADVIEEMMS